MANPARLNNTRGEEYIWEDCHGGGLIGQGGEMSEPGPTHPSFHRQDHMQKHIIMPSHNNINNIIRIWFLPNQI